MISSGLDMVSVVRLGTVASSSALGRYRGRALGKARQQAILGAPNPDVKLLRRDVRAQFPRLEFRTESLLWPDDLTGDRSARSPRDELESLYSLSPYRCNHPHIFNADRPEADQLPGRASFVLKEKSAAEFGNHRHVLS